MHFAVQLATDEVVTLILQRISTRRTTETLSVHVAVLYPAENSSGKAMKKDFVEESVDETSESVLVVSAREAESTSRELSARSQQFAFDRGIHSRQFPKFL